MYVCKHILISRFNQLSKMIYGPRYLIDAIDNQRYELLRKILINEEQINNRWTDENTLNRSIKAIFGNHDINRFNLGIIKLLFKRGARCINSSKNYNTLNIAITCSGRYIDSFKNDKKKRIAEQNAIKVIDIVIKHGAQALNCRDANTLSIAMNCANLNILTFLINANLNLQPYNYNWNLEFYRKEYHTLTCAFIASQKTGKADFFRFALINGALPNYNDDLIQQIFESQIVSIVDCIVFGGDPLIHSFSLQFHVIAMPCAGAKITDEKKIEILEIIVCMCGDVFLYFRKYFSDQIKEFINGCYVLFNKKYLWYNKDSIEYKNAIDIKNRLQSRIEWITDIARNYEKNNGRKEMIENEIIQLPIALIDIISGYESMPRFTTIDLSEYRI